MNTKVVIGVVAAIVIIAGAFLLMNKKGADQPQQATGPQSLKALIALGIPQQCEFTDTTDAAQTSGTVYTAGGKARGDFTATANGQTFHAHSIMEKEVVYTWIDETSMGMKITVDPNATSTTSNSQQFDENKAMDYHCTPWVPDQSKFEVPTTINFTSFTPGAGAAAGGTVPAGSGIPAGAADRVNSCKACDSVPEAYRAQCKAAAGC